MKKNSSKQTPEWRRYKAAKAASAQALRESKDAMKRSETNQATHAEVLAAFAKADAANDEMWQALTAWRVVDNERLNRDAPDNASDPGD